jgi:hypothetical protein
MEGRVVWRIGGMLLDGSLEKILRLGQLSNRK